ncbi:MAG: AraC family transcriptional regulator [Lachnospiraceae bacterium]|nr:AraC family transcriptional regulator [Lachnospiraceae bacterium]
MITNEIINQAIDYIMLHIEEVTLEEVAAYCHFSKYYFCRLFKAQTGESVHAFIRRLRLEQSAFRLKVEQERPITEISGDYGYSSSNYSSAFRQHYQIAPITFRKNSFHHSIEHPFFHHEEWKVGAFEDCNDKITVKELPDYQVIYERRFGSYEGISTAWEIFLEKYQEYITEETRLIERTFDDPAVTASEHCIFDICMSTADGCPVEHTTVLQGGKCLVYPFKGYAKHIYAAYQTIFLVWLPRTTYEMDSSRSLFDVYHRVDSDAMRLEMDICIPIK